MKVGQRVRILAIPEGEPDAHGIVQTVYPDGRVWVSSLNMPFYGTLSGVFQPDELKAE